MKKVDSENKAALNGAEFGLYKQEEGRYLLVQSLTTGIDGYITFQDMEMDTLYKLVEEKPPNGYAVIAGEVYFRVVPNEGTMALVFYDDAGKVISAPHGIAGEYIAGNRLLTLTVENLRGYELPSTGGMGMPLYMLCGLMLALAPLLYGLGLKRKSGRRSKKQAS